MLTRSSYPTSPDQPACRQTTPKSCILLRLLQNMGLANTAKQVLIRLSKTAPLNEHYLRQKKWHYNCWLGPIRPKRTQSEHWQHAMRCASTIINGRPNPKLDWLTHLEATYVERGYVKIDLKAFGCLAAIHVPPTIHKKLEYERHARIYIGNSTNSLDLSNLITQQLYNTLPTHLYTRALKGGR